MVLPNHETANPTIHVKLQFQSSGMYRAYARIHPNGTKVPTCETFAPTGIKSEVHAPGFYESSGFTAAFCLNARLRREGFFDKLKGNCHRAVPPFRLSPLWTTCPWSARFSCSWAGGQPCAAIHAGRSAMVCSTSSAPASRKVCRALAHACARASAERA